MSKHMPQLLSVMTPFPYHIEASRPVDEALHLMQAHNIRHLPVMIDGVIEALVSDRDIKRAQLIGHRGSTSEDLCVGDIAPTACYFADVSDPLDQVLEHMLARQAEAIVVFKEGTPVGIFTATDACRSLIELLRDHYPDEEDDDAA